MRFRFCAMVMLLMLLISLPLRGFALDERTVEFQEKQSSYQLTEKGRTLEKKIRDVPFLQQGKLMIPLRPAVEALGMVLEYEPGSRKTIIRTPNHFLYSAEEGKGKKLTTDNIVWIFYFDHHLMHVSDVLGSYDFYMEFDTPPLVRNGATFMAADEMAKLFNRSFHFDAKSKKARIGKELPFDRKSYMAEIHKNLSHRRPYRGMNEEDQRGVGIPDALRDRIDLFTRLNSYDAAKISVEKADFLLAKTMERIESQVFHGGKDPYGIDFSESMIYGIPAEKIDRLIEDLFCGAPSAEKIRSLITDHLDGKTYYFDGIGYSEDREEVPYAGGRFIPDPVVDRIKKLKKDVYLAEITFFPKFSGPMQDFSQEDLDAFAEEGIIVTDDHLFHYPKEYGYLIYETLPKDRYRILYFERERLITKAVFRRFSN